MRDKFDGYMAERVRTEPLAAIERHFRCHRPKRKTRFWLFSCCRPELCVVVIIAVAACF